MRSARSAVVLALILMLSACGQSGDFLLGEAEELSEETRGEIMDELRDRALVDQIVRTTARDDEDYEEMREIDEANTTWLSETLAEVGWVDVDRFGVDKYRAELGLKPLAEYLNSFGEPVALE